MPANETHCLEPDLQSKIMMEVGFQLGLGKPLALSEEARRHLDVCPVCRDCLPVWTEKARGIRRVKEETEIIQLAAAGDPSVLRRSTKEGTALFRVTGDGEDGTVVVVGEKSPFDIRRVLHMTKSEFGDWQL